MTTLLGRLAQQVQAGLLADVDAADDEEGKHGGNHGGLPLLDWTLTRRRMLAPGVSFNLADHRYMAGIYQDRRREIAVMKSGQGGATEWLISYALHACDVRRMNVLYLLPTVGDVSDFSQMRVGTALEASAHLAALVVAGRDEGGKRGSDKVMLKRIRDRFLIMRGTQVRAGDMARERTRASQLKSVPADAVVYDEFDEMSPNVEALATMRLGHSRVQEQRFVSTPTYPGLGIHAKWLASTQGEWFVPCPHCGCRQPLTIKHVVISEDELERPVAWHGQKEGRAWAACERCVRELDRLAEGEWVEAYPDRELAGYHFNKLATAQTPLLDIVERLQETSAEQRTQAFNQDLGLPYKPQGSGLDDMILDACRRDYAHGVHAGEMCVMGVDVGRVLHVVVRGQSTEDGGEADGRPQRWAGEVASFDDLGPLMQRFNVGRCVVDALPETRSARLFQQGQPRGRVWLAYYSLNTQGTKDADPVRWNDGALTIEIDRTRLLDETVSRFMTNVNTLPGNIRALSTYYEHLKALVRTEHQRPDGVTVAAFVQTGPDHYAHAEAYCTAASLPHRPPRAGTWGGGRR